MTREAGEKTINEVREVALLVSYIALLVVSVILLLEAGSIPVSRFEVVGAGAFPTLIHSVLILILLSAIAKSFWKLPRQAYARTLKAIPDLVWQGRLVVVLFISLGVYIAIMPVVGYSISTFVFLMVLQLAYAPWGHRTFIIVPIIALAFSFGLNFVFYEYFRVFLPRGAI